MGVFPSKSSILIGFSITNHPFWGTPIFGNIHILYHLGGGLKDSLFSSLFGEMIQFD